MAVDFSWTELPFDLLRAIAMKLECMQDMLAFADVCSSWRAMYVNLKPVWSPAMPWLILAENNDNNPLCIRTVVDLNNNKRYQMKLPETFGRRCWGCEHGWIFTLDLDMETHLFNPLTKARLSLPSALTLPVEQYVFSPDDPGPRELIRRDYIKKVHVISIPPDDKLLVMVIYDDGDLAAAQPGDSVWSLLELCFHPKRSYLKDVLQYGDAVIVALDEDRALQFSEADFFLRPDNPSIEGFVLAPESESEPEFDVSNSYLCLHDYSDGRILAVIRKSSESDSIQSASESDSDTDESVSDPTVGYQTGSFEVYFFDIHGKVWHELYDLGGAALFVGNGSAMCVQASRVSKCKPNCIYFTDDRAFGSRLIGHDTGVFDMEDESIERVYHGVDILSKFCPPFWFMPKLA